MKNVRVLLSSTVTCALAMITAGQANAQVSEPGASASKASASESDGGDIVVTARRREESLQTVPVAVTALTGDSLDRLGVEQIEDLSTAAIGLQVNATSQRGIVTFTMRGQTQIANGGAPGVQAYFDELPLIQGGLDFYDIERVEVLRGPQGTLFGRNTTGGAVRIIPKRPIFDFDGYVRASVGNYAAREIEGAVNVPLVSEALAIRVAGSIVRRDGYVRNLVSDQDLNSDHSESVRVTVLARPSERVESRFLFNYRNSDNNGTAMVFNQLNTLRGAFGAGTGAFLEGRYPTANTLFAQAYDLALASKFRKLRSDLESDNKQEDFLIENVTSIDVSDDVTIRNIIGYGRSKQLAAWDLDSSTLELLHAIRTSDVDSFSNEFQVLGSAVAGRLDWIVGAYYEKQGGGTPTVRTDLRQFGGRPFTTIQQPGTSKALFGQINFDFGKGLSATAGGRYTWDERGITTTTQATAPFTVERKFSAPNWAFSLNYQASPNALFYIAQRRGYKAGGLNGFSAAPLPFEYEPETLTDVELGTKLDWQLGEAKGRLNVAAFRGVYNELQRTVTAPDATGRLATFIFNAGKAVIQGAEVEFQVSPVPFLDLNINYALTDAKYKRFTSYTGQDLSNSKMMFTPRHQLTLGATAKLPIDPSYGEVAFSGTYNYQSRTFFSEPNILAFGQGSYGLLNLRAEWNDIMGSNFSGAVFAQNVTDKAYFTGGGFNAFAAVQVGPPRFYGVQLRYSFGASAR
jgi:iron complex outermembrane receptor protein